VADDGMHASTEVSFQDAETPPPIPAAHDCRKKFTNLSRGTKPPSRLKGLAHNARREQGHDNNVEIQ
jgi:hypothetical protein